MTKLYGINSYSTSGDEQNCVVAALDEEDAVKEFYKDPNHRMYNKIYDIYELEESGLCDVLYQYGNEVLYCEELEYELVKVENSMGYWNSNDFTIKVYNISDKIKKLLFKKNLVHSNKDKIEVMVCVYDWRPNWINY